MFHRPQAQVPDLENVVTNSGDFRGEAPLVRNGTREFQHVRRFAQGLTRAQAEQYSQVLRFLRRLGTHKLLERIQRGNKRGGGSSEILGASLGPF